MQAPPISQAEIDRRIHGHIDELLELWRTEQGALQFGLGYDHTTLLGSGDTHRIGDRLSPAGWIRLVERARFAPVDVLSRDADQVIVAGIKSSDDRTSRGALA